MAQLEMHWRDPARSTRGIDPRAVEEALGALARGFLTRNEALRGALDSGELSAQALVRRLARLACQLVFVLTVEARGLLHPKRERAAARRRYANEHGLTRWLERGGDDRWPRVQRVLRGLGHGDAELGLPALGGLFAEEDPLAALALDDRALRAALGALREGTPTPLRPEDLGSVYEAALAFVPEYHEGALTLTTAKHSARRSAGSYYTPDALVQAVLDGALTPVIEQRASTRLTKLAIVDPACGTGYFLLAAARRLQRALPSPSPATLRRILRDCVFGVDVDPLAIALCKLCLWLEAATPSLPLATFDANLQCGNALFGATPARMARGIPDEAWSGDRPLAQALRQRNRRERAAAPNTDRDAQKLGLNNDGEKSNELTYDTWCSSFVWPVDLHEHAPTHARWSELADTEMLRAARALAAEHRFFHWPLRFARVLARGGFDVVIGNPPWIAHAGRAAQPLPAGLKRFYEVCYPAFADYPTTHALFASVVPQYLRPGGMLGLVLPSSLSELGGYAPARLAHDRLCEIPGELTDFGEGRFEGVTQPCMALISRRAAGGRRDAAPGSPWPVARPDLSALDRQLLERLTALPTAPATLFGERGIQSDKSLRQHFLESSAPHGRFTTPIREGTDVREHALAPPRFHVDRVALGDRLRADAEFAAVDVLIRQTARYPIAARSDGLPFRNSLLAGFANDAWPADALVAWLNSALVRWLHYQRFRDARQPVMPQVKIAHLRALPAPPHGSIAPLARLPRAAIDAYVAELYALSDEERRAVETWHAAMRPRA